jgi:hypothetical protein
VTAASAIAVWAVANVRGSTSDVAPTAGTSRASKAGSTIGIASGGIGAGGCQPA